MNFYDTVLKKIVANAPYCVMPLQVKKNADKKSFIFDMSVLNAYVQTNSLNQKVGRKCLKMYKTATCGVKFDFKKLYHEIDLALEEYQYYGFSLPLIEGQKDTYFV